MCCSAAFLSLYPTPPPAKTHNPRLQRMFVAWPKHRATSIAPTPTKSSLFPRQHRYQHLHYRICNLLCSLSSVTMPTTWNAESDAMLFRAVVVCMPPLSQLSPEQRDGIVAFMHRNGFPGTSWDAIRYVTCCFHKLRNARPVSVSVSDTRLFPLFPPLPCLPSTSTSISNNYHGAPENYSELERGRPGLASGHGFCRQGAQG